MSDTRTTPKPGSRPTIYVGGDTAACSRSDCPRAGTCRRYMGKRHDYWQTNGQFEPDGCEYHMPIREEPTND